MLRGQRECEPPTSREKPLPWLPTPGPLTASYAPKGEGEQSWPLLSYGITDSKALKLGGPEATKEADLAPSPPGPVSAAVHPNSVTARAAKRCVCDGTMRHRSASECGPAGREAGGLALGQSQARVADRGRDTRAGGPGPGQAQSPSPPAPGTDVGVINRDTVPQDGEQGALGFTAPVPRILSCSPSKSWAVGPSSSITPSHMQPTGTQRPPKGGRGTDQSVSLCDMH